MDYCYKTLLMKMCWVMCRYNTLLRAPEPRLAPPRVYVRLCVCVCVYVTGGKSVILHYSDSQWPLKEWHRT